MCMWVIPMALNTLNCTQLEQQEHWRDQLEANVSVLHMHVPTHTQKLSINDIKKILTTQHIEMSESKMVKLDNYHKFDKTITATTTSVTNTSRWYQPSDSKYFNVKSSSSKTWWCIQSCTILKIYCVSHITCFLQYMG